MFFFIILIMIIIISFLLHCLSITMLWLARVCLIINSSYSRVTFVIRSVFTVSVSIMTSWFKSDFIPANNDNNNMVLLIFSSCLLLFESILDMSLDKDESTTPLTIQPVQLLSILVAGGNYFNDSTDAITYIKIYWGGLC